MSRLPRTTCPSCGRSVPVRRNGALREHNWPSGDPVAGKCPGSDRKPDENRKEASS